MTERVFEKKYTIEAALAGSNGSARAAGLLYLIQQISGDHAQLLGTGWEALDEKGLFWAIIRHRICVDRLPDEGEQLLLQTWPMPTTRTAYPRATVAYDRQGNRVFSSVALWVLMDRDTRTMVLPGKSGVLVEGILRHIEGDMPTGLSPVTLANRQTRQVCPRDLDRNGHMNNTRYLDWVEQLLGEEFHREHSPEQISLCYLSEAKLGQPLQLSWQLSDTGTLRAEAAGERAQEGLHRVFGAEITYVPIRKKRQDTTDVL